MTSQQEARQQAVAQLTALADRHGRAVQSFTRMIARIATSEDATAIVTSIAKYVNAGMPDAGTVADIATMLEGGQPPEWQEKRAKAREEALRQKLAWQVQTGREQGENVSAESVLSAARYRRDVIAAVIAVCEQRRDEDGKIAADLAKYLRGECSAFHLEMTLKVRGLSVSGANVVPLIPRGAVRP